MSPSAEQQSTPRPVYRRHRDAGKQKGLGPYLPSPMIPTSMREEGSPVLPDSRRAVESPSSEMGDSSMQLDTDLTPVNKVGSPDRWHSMCI